MTPIDPQQTLEGAGRPSKFGEYARWWNSQINATRNAINRGLIGNEDIFNAGWDAALAKLAPTQGATHVE